MTIRWPRPWTVPRGAFVSRKLGSVLNTKMSKKKKTVLWAMVLLAAFGVGFALGVTLWEGNVAPPESGDAGIVLPY
jgi:predicted membrane protein